jgi:hypothetical protein
MEPEVILMIVLTFSVPAAVVLHQVVKGQFFTLLSFYSLIFLLENTGGAIKAITPVAFPWSEKIDTGLVANTLVVALAAYVLFLCGYAIYRPHSPQAKKTAQKNSVEAFFTLTWNQRYRSLLYVAIVVSICAGFVQQLQRIRAAGGIDEFIHTAYQYRFGNYAETEGESALIGVAGVISNCAVGLIGILWLAWLKGKLRRPEKALLVVLFAVLLLRQWSTMFRATLFFTFASMIAIYNSEKPLKLAHFAFTSGVAAVVLIVFNFIHLYLFYLTAEWDYQPLGETITLLATPHGHFQQLAQVLNTHNSSGELLHGHGFLESVLFFVPRVVWTSKAAFSDYGTILVQDWAGFPDAYQIAITNVGELVAHFGYVGLSGLVAYGLLYRLLDSFRWRGVEFRMGLFCLLLPRTFADLGMGVSAVSTSLFNLSVFIALAMALRVFSRANRQDTAQQAEKLRRMETSELAVGPT